MKKTIRMLMTSTKAVELGMAPRTTEKVLAPVEVELDDLSACARWIAEHITSTAVYDEVRDQCHIRLEADKSRMDFDREAGVAEKELQRRLEILGEEYTAPRSSAPLDCALVLGLSITPEYVFERLALQARGSGADRMTCDGDSFDLHQTETIRTSICAGYADPACDGLRRKLWTDAQKARTLCVELPGVYGRDPKSGEPLLELDGECFALRDVLRGESGTPVIVWQHGGEEKRLPLKVL